MTQKRTVCVLILLIIGGILAGSSPAYAATSIDLASCTVASGGKTITCPLSGVTGAVSPTSSVTGISVTMNLGGVAELASTTSVTASGTSGSATLTINLDAIAASSETVNIALATSSASNLTDGSSDTPAGNNVNATNNSSFAGTTASVGGAALVLNGLWYSTSTSGGQYVGHDLIYIKASNARIDFGFTGTGLDMLTPPASGATDVGCQFILDNGSSTITVHSPSSAWMRMNVFSGLANTTHTVMMSGTYCFTATDVPIVFATSPTTPSIQLPTGESQNITPLNALAPHDIVSGGWTLTDNAYPETAWQQDFNLSIKATGPDIWFWGFDWGSTFEIYKDGVDFGSYTQPADYLYTLQHVISGADTNPHVWTFIDTGNDEVGGYEGDESLYSIMATGGVDTTYSPAVPHPPSIMYFGDSITSCNYIPDSRQCIGYLMGQKLGTGSIRYGSAGENITQLKPAFNAGSPYSMSTVQTPVPVIVLDQDGVNDVDADISIGNCSTPGTFTGDWLGLLNAQSTAFGTSTTLVARTVIRTQGDSTSTVATYSAAIQTAEACFNASTTGVQAKFIPNIWGYNPYTDTASDNIHPSAVGEAKIVNSDAPYLYAYLNSSSSYSVNGPTSGTADSPSANFTVALAASSTFVSGQTITLSDGSQGGTFTPSVGSPAANSLTVNPTPTTTSFTFTYNAASAGAKTISFTNNASWIDPTSIIFTASAADTTSSAPQSLTSTAGNGQISLSWSAPSSDGGSSVTEYLIYDRFTGGGSFILTATTTASTTNATITSLSNGQSYDFEVVAQNGVGTSTPSNIAAATPTTPVSGGGGSSGGIVSVASAYGSPNYQNAETSPIPTSSLTASIQAYINELTVELQSLLAHIASSSSSSPSPSQNAFLFTRDLQLYDRGTDVQMLQKYLNTHGFVIAQSGPGSPSHETTTFGSKTRQALAAFQKSVGIAPAVGYFGPITKAYVNAHE